MLLLIAAALAVPIRYEILEDAPSGLAGRAQASFGSLPVTDAEVVVDETRELLWDTVTVAPPLVSFADGRPTDLSVQAAIATDAFVVRLEPLPEDWSATLTIDPDGSNMGFWRVEHSPDRVWLEHCPAPTAQESGDAAVSPKAWVCEEVLTPAVLSGRSEDGLEIGIPWELMSPATAHMKVVIKATDGDGRGGTVVKNGSGGTQSAVGVGIQRGNIGGSWVLRDPATADWTLVLRRTAPTANPIWTWRRSQLGTIVDEGTLDLRQGDRITLPPLEYGFVLVRETGTYPVMPAVLVTEPIRVPIVKLHTPVFREAIELSFTASRPTATVLSLVTDAGLLLGQETLTLPEEPGRLRVFPPANAPESFFIDLEPGLVPVRVTRRLTR